MLKKTAHDLVAAARATIRECSLDDARRLLAEGVTLLDVREPDEFAAGHLAHAANVPRGLLEFRLSADPALADPARPVLLYCKSGGRAALAAATLQQMGFTGVCSIAGGYDAWRAAGLPVEQPAPLQFD